MILPSLGTYLEKTIIWKDACTPMFIAALFTIPRTWKQPKCPSRRTDKDVGHVYNGILFNHKKEWNSAICSNMNGPIDDQNEINLKWSLTQVKPSRTLWGPWAQKPSCVSHSLFVGNRLQPPWPSLSSEGQISTAAHQGRESREKQGRRNQESIVQTWGRSWFYPMGYT